MNELYVESTLTGVEGAPDVEVLMVGSRQQVAAERKRLVAVLKEAGRLTQNMPDIHDPLATDDTTSQTVVANLNTKFELTLKFVIGVRS